MLSARCARASRMNDTYVIIVVRLMFGDSTLTFEALSIYYLFFINVRKLGRNRSQSCCDYRPFGQFFAYGGKTMSKKTNTIQYNY